MRQYKERRGTSFNKQAVHKEGPSLYHQLSPDEEASSSLAYTKSRGPADRRKTQQQELGRSQRHILHFVLKTR